jgi:hypothetical protein
MLMRAAPLQVTERYKLYLGYPTVDRVIKNIFFPPIVVLPINISGVR